MTAPPTSTRLDTFRLPDLGEGLTEADIIRWLVAEGDEVAVDQLLVEVETAKSIVEVPSPFAGRVATLHAAAGTTVAVGADLITISAASTAPAAAETYREEERAGSGNVLIGYGTPDAGGRGRRRRPRARVADTSSPTTAAARTPAPGVENATRRPPSVASPLVRRLARDGGVDLTELTATGKDGVITRSDVVRALAAQTTAGNDIHGRTPGATTGERRIPLTGFRKAVASQLSRSRREIPEATVWVDVDVTPLWDLREGTRTPDDPGPGLMAYVARFVVAGLKRYPVLNARLDVERDEIVEHDHVHLGLAVQSPRGLVVPAVMHADSMTTEQLSAAMRDVVARAREGRTTAVEMAAATFTLNNYGSFRVDGSTPIINHPQVAILGIGRILDRPWVSEGELTIRKLAQLSFAFDHRVCDGDIAAGFVRVVADAIEDPAASIRGL